MSDVHNEFNEFIPPPCDEDLVILAGDIGVGYSHPLQWISKHWPETPVVYVFGNHEYYNNDLDTLNTIRLAAPVNVHILENEVLDLSDIDDNKQRDMPLRVLGTTLWTDFLLYGEEQRRWCMKYADENMNDFFLIENGNFKAQDSAHLNAVAKHWLSKRLLEPYNDIVVTHHLPSMRSVHPRFIGERLNAAFASEMRHMMGSDWACLWVHGHTHDSCDYNEKGTRVVCNPRGYIPRFPNLSFNRSLVIEI